MSPIIFNLCLADLNEELGKIQGALIMMNRMSVITYADDIVLIAIEEVVLKAMIKNLQKYIRKKNLKLPKCGKIQDYDI